MLIYLKEKRDRKARCCDAFSEELFCLEAGVKPCESCQNCKRIQSGNHPDLHLVQPDGQSIKKAQVQALQEEFTKAGVESHRKMYIILHADKMTVNAANSLLKFLEEPNRETMAVLITEQSHKMLDTIISRCQMLSFQPLQPQSLEQQLLQEGVSQDLARLLSNLTNNLAEALELSRNDQFAESRAKVIKLYEVLHQRKEHAFFIYKINGCLFSKRKTFKKLVLICFYLYIVMYCRFK